MDQSLDASEPLFRVAGCVQFGGKKITKGKDIFLVSWVQRSTQFLFTNQILG